MGFSIERIFVRNVFVHIYLMEIGVRLVREHCKNTFITAVKIAM